MGGNEPDHCSCGRPYPPDALTGGRFVGINYCDGHHLALFNCECLSTRTIPLRPVPRWFAEEEDRDAA